MPPAAGFSSSMLKHSVACGFLMTNDPDLKVFLTFGTPPLPPLSSKDGWYMTGRASGIPSVAMALR